MATTGKEQPMLTAREKELATLVDTLARTRPQDIIHFLEREHRTNQQKITATMLQWLLHLAEEKEHKHFDARNERSVEVARALAEKIKEMTYDGKLPHI